MAAPPARGVSDIIHSEHDQGDEKQLQTFTRWWNGYLEPRGFPVTDLCEQIKSGLLPFRLLETLEGLPVAEVRRGKVNIMGASVHNAPKMRVQRVENLNLFLRVVDEHGVKLVNIGGEDLEEAKVTLVLGLTWELIKFYELSGRVKRYIPPDESGNAQAPAAVGGGGGTAELFDWVREQAAAYPEISLGTGAAWGSAFRDGKVLCALVESGRPGLIDYSSTSAMSAEVRLATCFDAAATIGVPKLLDASDVSSGTVGRAPAPAAAGRGPLRGAAPRPPQPPHPPPTPFPSPLPGRWTTSR